MVEVDAAVLQDILNRLEELEQFRAFHQGIDIGTAGLNYPHPYLKVVSADFGSSSQGGPIGRISTQGIQILSTTAAYRKALYFVPVLSDKAPTLDAYIAGTVNNGDPYISVGVEGPGPGVSYITCEAHNATPNKITALAGTSGFIITQGGTFDLNIYSTPIQIATFNGDPGTLTDGMIWYRSDLNAFRFRAGGVTNSLALP